MDDALKKQIVMAVEPVFLSPLVHHLTGFGQVSALTMLHNLFSSYREINFAAVATHHYTADMRLNNISMPNTAWPGVGIIVR